MSSSEVTPVLELSGVAVAAGGIPLLNDVSLSLHPGERVALTGPSGGGKSTLLRAICGLDDPTAGMIRLKGRTPDEWGYPAFRRQVVFVEQRPILPDKTVEECLRRAFSYKSATNPYPVERVSQLFEQLSLGVERLSQKARSLSVGQQQRVCLIRALILAPAVLLLDEPTSALDPETVESVEMLFVTEAEREGRAILLVTHDPNQAKRLCQRVIDLREFKKV